MYLLIYIFICVLFSILCIEPYIYIYNFFYLVLILPVLIHTWPILSFFQKYTWGIQKEIKHSVVLWKFLSLSMSCCTVGDMWFCRKVKTTKYKMWYLLAINKPHTTAAEIGMKCNHLSWTELTKVHQFKCYLIHFVYWYSKVVTRLWHKQNTSHWTS